jgi:caffeoyl-CoA O-methyltransferase
MSDRPVADPLLEAYAAEHSTPPPEELREVAAGTRSFSQAHGMMVGDVVGRLLAILVGASGARRVLEIGTFTGYSALSMAAALPPDGRILSLEVDPAHADKAREHISAVPYGKRIEILVGPALESLRRISGPFDLVFLDADKPGYPGYLEAVVPLLAPGGLLVADNVLWSGRVADEGEQDRATRALRSFNDAVVADPRLESVLLTVRDGLMIARRRG